MNLPRPKALLFDWDNTLVDSWHAIHHAINVTFKVLDQEPWSLAETKARVRASARDSFPALFGIRSDEATEIFYRAFESDHLQQLREHAGAGALLSRLAELDYHLAVVSNKQGYLLRREAEHLGWTGYFRALVGASDAARDKPAVQPVDLALQDSGIPRGPEVWFVGDTDIDMECAVNAGCFPILLRQEPPGQEEFAAAAPKCHVTSCAALAELLPAP